MRRRRVAVVDTTLLMRLRDLGVVDKLPLILDEVRVPATVLDEVGRQRGKVKRWVTNLLRTQADFFIRCTDEDRFTREFISAQLDAGEAAAIAQADHLRAAIVIDERAGREVAERMSLDVLPTGRLLLRLKEAGAIADLAPKLDHLRRLGFHLAEPVYCSLLAEAGESAGRAAAPRRR